MSLTLVTGGTRSGKSAHAERLAAASGLPVRYVATADPGDASMAPRIARHVARRPAAWMTVEAGADLADALAGGPGACVLLDGLGAWIAGALQRAGAFEDAARLPAAHAEVLAAVDRGVCALRTVGAAIVVAEQAGSGLLPPDGGSRAWLDLLGAATERIAAAADVVELVVAGRAVRLGGRPGDHWRRPADPALRHHVIGGRPGDHRRRPADPALRHHGDRDVRPGDADHAVNVAAGDPPPWLHTALTRALDADAGRYPREEAACSAVAARHGRRADEVVPTNGGAEALWLLGPALRPALAACVHPGFTEAEAALHAHGIPVVRVHRDPGAGFALDPGAVPEAADLVVVGNPASPSGTLDPAAALLALRRPGRTLVVDEAFMDLVPGEPGSLAGEALPDVIVIRSLTKVLGVPGLRAGYALAAPALADRLRAVRPPWSANVLALATLQAAAEHSGALRAIAERAASEREDLTARLRAIDGLRVWPGAANFVLCELDDGLRVVAALRAEGIAVRPAGSFPGLDDRHVRITARGPRENATLAASLARALALAGAGA